MIAGRVGVAATHAVDSVLAADLCVTCVLRRMLTHRLPQLKTVVDRNIILQKATIRALSITQVSIRHLSNISALSLKFSFLLAHPAADQTWNLSGKSRSWIV